MGAGRTVGVSLCLAVSCLAPASPATGADTSAVPALAGAPNPGPIRIRDSFTAHAVRGAFRGAARRLRQPGCQEVFAEFTDSAGRSLRENLLAQGETGDSYLENKMLFYDGLDEGRCRQASVMAYTEPGSRVVLVCGRAFEKAYRREARIGEAILIHEALHSLGLGENPPSSWDITARVLQKCTR